MASEGSADDSPQASPTLAVASRRVLPMQPAAASVAYVVERYPHDGDGWMHYRFIEACDARPQKKDRRGQHWSLTVILTDGVRSTSWSLHTDVPLWTRCFGCDDRSRLAHGSLRR